MYASVKVLGFRLDYLEGTGSRDAIDNNLLPDFILPKTSCCSYVASEGFLNGQVVGFKDRDGSSIVIGDKLDFVVGGKLYSSNKRLLDCRVDSIAYSQVCWYCLGVLCHFSQ